MANKENGQPDVSNTDNTAELEMKIQQLQKDLDAANERADTAEKSGAETAEKLAALEAAAKKNTAEKRSGKVRIKIPIEKNGPKTAQQVFLNGRQFIIKRGVEVEVPKGVAEILRNRERQLEVISTFNDTHASD